jgi:predicted Zn-ribbon and HTH transcriptional regulator
MNDRFTDMGFSQGHQSCGGSPIFQSGKSANPWAREARLFASFFLHLRKQEGGRVVKALDITIRMSTPLWVRSSCVSRFQGTFSKKTRISESRKPEKVETQNGEMILISPLRCRNLEFLLFRLCVFAFTISRFNFVFQNPKAKSNIL